MSDFNVPPLMPPQMLRPARQASVLLLILAGLALIAAAMALFMAFVPMDQWPPEELQNVQRLIEPTGWSVKTYFQAMASMMGGMGLILCVLGLLVRRGGRPTIVLSMLVNGLLLLMALKSIVDAIRGGSPLSAIPPLGLAAMMIMLSQRLAAAFRAAGAARALAAQSWRQFQEPLDTGYGYNDPLPPPPQSPDDGAKS
jgi:hypothetical protein